MTNKNNNSDRVYTLNRQLNKEQYFEAISARLAKIEGIAMLVITSDVLELEMKYIINCFWAIQNFAEELIEITEELQKSLLINTSVGFSSQSAD